MRSFLRYLIPIYDPQVENWAIEARILRWLTLLWLFIGLITLFSASFPVANFDDGDGFLYVKKQLVWAFIGLNIFNFLVRFPVRNLLKISPTVFLFLLFLIFLTLIPGVGVLANGSNRWLKVGPLVLQPSDLIKPFLVLQGALIFGKWQRLDSKVKLKWLAIFAILLAFILKQPNLSTTALSGISLWLIALAAGLPLVQLGGVALAGFCVGLLSIKINPYQFERINSFLDPFADPSNTGFQLVQSLYAIGSGGEWGVGFGQSQQKLFYLPFQYTDFIFAIFAEEFGFVGSLVLFLLLISYGTLGLFIALKCKDRVKRLVAIGVVILMIGQSLLNIGVNTGSLPTTGVTLPLFSYGGSSLLASLVLAALLIRIARENHEEKLVSIKKKKSNQRSLKIVK